METLFYICAILWIFWPLLLIAGLALLIGIVYGAACLWDRVEWWFLKRSAK